MIHARLDSVSEILRSMGSSEVAEIDSTEEKSDIGIVQPEIHHLISSVLATLGRAPDVQRGITRIFHRTATPSEVTHKLTYHSLTLDPILICDVSSCEWVPLLANTFACV